MATPKLFLSRVLRCHRPIHAISSSTRPTAHQSGNPYPQSNTGTFFFHTLHSQFSILSNTHLLESYSFSCSRFFWTRNKEHSGPQLDEKPSTAESGDSGFGFSGSFGEGNSGVAEAVVSIGATATCTGTSNGNEYNLPIRAVVSMLDGFHEITGLPWWITLAFSALAVRVVLLPILIMQLKKLKRIAEILPRLPPPTPPPLSGQRYKDQFTLFWNAKRDVGCPSFMWFIAYISVQVPCFLLLMTTIRRMSLDQFPGFDGGGILWFQNLSEVSHSLMGFIFPMLIAGLHLLNVQVSFHMSSVRKMRSLLGLLAKYYKIYLQFLAVPIFFTGFYLPQGSLVFWVTSSSLTLVQQLALNNPNVREKLRLPDKGESVISGKPQIVDESRVMSLGSSAKKQKVPADSLSPRELVNLSIQFLAKGDKESASPLLRLALNKDPEYIRALIVMGQTLVQEGHLIEAAGYLEHAIGKLLGMGIPTEVEEVDLLITASQWAGVALARQGKNVKAIEHLERIACLKEPEDLKSKARYYDGLLLLASTLLNERRNAEAAKYVSILAAYDPAYGKYLKDCEGEENDFVDDLVNSRRKDY